MKKLDNLKPAKGSNKKKKRLGRGPGSGLERLLVKDTKAKKHVKVAELLLALKVVKCLFIEDYLKEALKTLSEKSIIQ